MKQLAISSPKYDDRIYIIVPAFNENVVIRGVVEELILLNYRVIVIDDGSATAIKKELNSLSGVVCLRHKVNLGQGAALQTGIEYALKNGADYIVTFDADGQHCAADIPRLLSPLVADEVDVTLASRFLTKGSHNASFFKTVILKGSRWVNYFFTGLYMSDSHNGFRAFNRYSASKIKINESRMAHATEIIEQIKKNRLRYKEISSKVSYTAYSRRKGQSAMQSFKILFDLILKKMFR